MHSAPGLQKECPHRALHGAPPDVNKVCTLEQFLYQQRCQDLLRFITCGSVDDGKSTLIGRLLWESGRLYDDQIEALKADSLTRGARGDGLDFSLLCDGLAAEREQGITIDVAYRYFATHKRRYIIADTPGHEQYTRNMITAASTADAAVLLVDACQGVLPQTRRHAYLVALTGIRQLILAVNKMDQIDFEPEPFYQIQESFLTFAASLPGMQITFIPLSALHGDNLLTPSRHTPWYSGPTLMAALDGIAMAPRTSGRSILPVQWVNRSDASLRGYCGTITGGNLREGDAICVAGTGCDARITEIIGMDGPCHEGQAGDAVTLRLDRNIDVSRGDILCTADNPPAYSDKFEATIVWMAQDPGMVGRSYDLKLAVQECSALITRISQRFNADTTVWEDRLTTKSENSDLFKLALNDICICQVSTGRPIAFDSYESSPTMGSFILIDRYSQNTIAAGMIRSNLGTALSTPNAQRNQRTVTRADREHLGGHQGRVLWFTGLSGAGKSTLANALEIALHTRGIRTFLLDGDTIRQGLNRDLGFSDADRVENIRRLAEVAKLMMDAGLVVITAFISPFRQEREMARSLIGRENFVEIYLSTPLATCESRDPKGLYRKARAGMVQNMTGLSSAYEPPNEPQVKLDNTEISIGDSVNYLLDQLQMVHGVTSTVAGVLIS